LASMHSIVNSFFLQAVVALLLACSLGCFLCHTHCVKCLLTRQYAVMLLTLKLVHALLCLGTLLRTGQPHPGSAAHGSAGVGSAAAAAAG
jgi:hypothetical protein